MSATPAVAVPQAKPGADKPDRHVDDNRLMPWSKDQAQLRETALERKLKGVASAQGTVARVRKGDFVELAREGTDKIFVVIAEFDDNRHSAFADSASDGSPQKFTGPAHNEIPQPDRSLDNSTLWQADYAPAHYEDMYFNRMARYYESQSSGRYSVEGSVTQWVKVPYNEARYGRNSCGGIVCNNTWSLIRDSMAVYVQDQLSQGKTMDEIKAYLATFDHQDRYDSDGDAIFDEPDGFIDHFQIVHSGGDEAAGDPTYGTDAIWSHRWYAAVSGGGPNGFPGVNAGQGVPAGSTGNPAVTIPDNPTGVWVGDYTIQPENGGLGVFAHEFGHDLGLPDLYDTSGNTGGAENSTGFWSLMSSGANIGDGGPDGIGDAPTDMGAWEKFQLGWLGCETCAGGKFYDTATAGEPRSRHEVGPAEHATKGQAQALFVLLPDKETSTSVVPPKLGSFAFWSGSGDDLSNRMTKAFVLPAAATIKADVWFDTEPQFDYGFLEVSSDGGTTWTPVHTNISKPASDDQGSFNSSGTGIGGTSGGVYLPMETTDALPAGDTMVRFRYETDGNTGGKGIVIDNLSVTGSDVDGAETDSGWTFAGFSRLQDGTAISKHFNAYIAENRGYRGFDKSLRTAYNFGFLDARPERVETHPYEDGLLISYWDTSFADNNVGSHPGGGEILPVDAHPAFHHSYDGHLLRPRILSFDSTFTLDRTDAITVHKDSKATRINSAKAVSIFDDNASWWFNSDGHASTGSHVGRYQPGWYGVDVPRTGTRIRLTDVNRSGTAMQVSVGSSPTP